MSVSILTDKLTKYYGHEKIPALHELSLEVKPGEVYGFLGANGAGKSTAIRLLLNFLQPSAGSAKIMGFDVKKQTSETKKHIGYLAGDVALYPKATGHQLLDYLSRLQPATSYRKELEKRFEADLNKPIATLSKGNRQKIGIIQAFMHEPTVLILDEPTSGLDPLMQEVFDATLQDAKQRGSAILMSSHNLDEAQRLCDRVGILKKGRLILEQPITEQDQLNTVIFKVTFTSHQDLVQCLRSHHLKRLGEEDGLTANFQPIGSIKSALAEFSHYDIQAFSTQSLDLENEFLEFYRSEK